MKRTVDWSELSEQEKQAEREEYGKECEAIQMRLDAYILTNNLNSEMIEELTPEQADDICNICMHGDEFVSSPLDSCVHLVIAKYILTQNFKNSGPRRRKFTPRMINNLTYEQAAYICKLNMYRYDPDIYPGVQKMLAQEMLRRDPYVDIPDSLFVNESAKRKSKKSRNPEWP
ncbi:MAG: hypothetical protein LBC41_07555 [Clostridiales bacterium]|jgi:hypothetical protein|nr:hypothetical protein [Clostridiales bacterium]MDR2750498.1 hypothetical protein [Clostridiales bacterium]